MARAFYDNMRPGTFKSVKFLMDDDDTEKGNAKVNYEYINTSRRVSKFLGGIPPSFKMTIFTHGLGQDYFDNRDALDRVLGSGASGPLVHPFWGGPFNVSVGAYSVRQTMRTVGKCYFNVTFDVCDKGDGNPAVPPDRVSNAAQNRALANAAYDELETASGAAMDNNTPLNYDSSVGIIQRMGDALGDVFGPLGDTIKKVSDYTGKALAIREKAAFYADNPLVFFAEGIDMLLGVDGLTLDVFAKFQACKGLFEFGDSGTTYSIQDASPVRIDPDPRTNEDAERETNSQVMGTFMQLGGTIEAFAQSGAIEFGNIQELVEVESDLDDQFDIVKDLITKNPEAEIYEFDVPEPDYSETYDALVKLRVSVQQYFDQQRLTTARIETINVAPIPASVLAYQLYQDSTRAEDILELNGLRDAMVLEGEIKVLSK